MSKNNGGYTRQIKKTIEDLNLVFLGHGQRDSRNHPTIFVRYPSFAKDNQIRRVAYSGTPANPGKALLRLKSKLKKILDGRSMGSSILNLCLRCGKEKTADNRHVCTTCDSELKLKSDHGLLTEDEVNLWIDENIDSSFFSE